MSSDTSVVTVLAVRDRQADLRVRTTTAGGLEDASTTRSFALLLLADARRRARDEGFPEPARPPALVQESAGWPEDWYLSEDFMRARAGDYVERTEVLARRNRQPGPRGAALEALVAWDAEVRRLGLPPAEAEARLCERYHHLDLRVTVTDPRWLEGLEPGLVFGSTAYDVWWDDPLRPPLPA